MDMRQFLDKLSISKRLVLANFLVLVVSFLLTIAAVFYFFTQDQNAKFLAKYQDKAQWLIQPVMGVLTSSAAMTAVDILEQLSADSNIVLGAIIDQDKRVFSRFQSSEAQQVNSPYIVSDQFIWPDNALDGFLFDSRFLHVYEKIYSPNGQLSGALYLQVERSAAHAQTIVLMAVMVLIFLFALVMTYGFTLWTESTIVQPINQLSEAIKHILTKKDFSIRAVAHSQDEFGLLIERFNNLIAHVERRDEALKFHKERLEMEVEAKTNYLKDSNAELESAIQALQAANRDLRASEADKQVAEKSAEIKATFLANMSHELRTPMNGVLGMINLLSESSLDNDQMYYVRVAQDSGNALLALLNDILDLSKIEKGMLSLEDIEFDLTQLIDEVFSVLGESAYKKNVELVWYCHSKIPDFVRGDPVRVRQVIYNIVGNAIKFTSSGFVSLTLACEPTQDGNGLLLTFRVTDTGLGIKKENQRSIFESFTQADSSTTRRFGGTGLGLALCKQLTQIMGGEIKLNSELGKGSVFTFTVRVRPGKAKKPQLQLPMKPHRALVLDDQTVSLIAVGQHLENLQIEYDAITSANLLLEKVRNTSKTYDLLVIDLSLPEVEPRDLIAAVRQEPDYHDTPIILMGSLEQRSQTSVQFAVQTQGHWIKPLRFSMIFDVLSRLGEQLGTEDQWLPSTQGLLPAPQSETTKNVSLNGYHILVVEDNAVNQQVAASRLKKMGYLVDTADDGECALRKIKQAQYDLIFMDCQMPVLDGYETTKRIRQLNPEIANLPIIAMTANAMSGDKDRCLAAGMNDYLSKPVNAVELETVLSQWLS